MDGDLGSILTGLAVVITAVGTVLTSRSRRSLMNVHLLKKDLKRMTRRFQVALRHIGRLEEHWAVASKKPPARPKELDPDWGLEDLEPPSDPQKAVEK